MKIAVCDDDPNAMEIFSRYAAAIIEYAFAYEFFQDPEEMLTSYSQQEQEPDLYILDIEMPGMDGIAVAQEIRKRNSKALIVFLTSYTKYMPDVFAVVTFDFIKKPITIDRLRILLEKAENYLGMTNLNSDKTLFIAFNNCYILSSKSPQTFENAKFIASEFALMLSLVLYPFPSCYEPS